MPSRRCWRGPSSRRCSVSVEAERQEHKRRGLAMRLSPQEAATNERARAAGKAPVYRVFVVTDGKDLKVRAMASDSYNAMQKVRYLWGLKLTALSASRDLEPDENGR